MGLDVQDIDAYGVVRSIVWSCASAGDPYMRRIGGASAGDPHMRRIGRCVSRRPPHASYWAVHQQATLPCTCLIYLFVTTVCSWCFLLQELESLRSELAKLLDEYDASTQTIAELSAQAQQLDAAISEKKAEMAALEVEMKDVNLELFITSSSATIENSIETVEEKTSPVVPQFTRSSSSRGGSSRKMPSTPARLRDAIQSEPQGYWV